MRFSSLVQRRRKVADGPAKAEPDIVILIHGTGAADPDPVTPKWWETESAYARDLQERLGPDFEVGASGQSAPFKWNGANSEKDRRRAGRELASRLQKLERDGRRYHLVGHSHGGSVIWHALWQSKKRLDGLRSWTSVGTPYLEFSPIWTGFTTLLALILVSMLTYFLMLQILQAAPEFAVVWRDANTAGVIAAAALSALLLLLVLMLAWAVLRWIVRYILIWRQRSTEAQAAATFADRWLGVWHAEDEPIAGLNASLISPLEFVPRLAKPSSNWLWRLLTAPFNHIFAPVTDQFVWTVLIRRLQGADIGGSVMIDAGSAPKALSPGWPSMPGTLSSDMVFSASKQAPHTIGNLRKRLSEMRGRGSGQEAFGELSSAITWTEILHTSYFDIPSVRGLIADHIERSAAALGTADQTQIEPSPLVTWLIDRPKAEPPEWPKPFQPVLLNFAKIAVFGGLAMLLFTGFKAAYDAYIAPHTLDGQLNILAQNATTREAMSGANVALVGEILVRLDMLGKLSDLPRLLRRIPDVNTRTWAGQRLAYHYALNGNFAPVNIILENTAETDVLDPADAAGFVYVHALAGAYDAQLNRGPGTSISPPPASFLNEAARRTFVTGYLPGDVDNVRVFDPRQNLNDIWLVPTLEALVYFKHRPSIAASGQRIEKVLNSDWLKPEEFVKTPASEQLSNCITAGKLAKQFDEHNLPPNLSVALKHCSTPPPIPSRITEIAEANPPTAAACPTDAELDTPSPRVGELHFTWKQSVVRIKNLLKRKCNDAAMAAVRRHIPNPKGNYETAEFGLALAELAQQLEPIDAEGATEIAKYNLKWSPVAIASLTIGAGRRSISSALCLNKCSNDELRAFAAGYQKARRLDVVPSGTKQIDFAQYRVIDKFTYRLAAATIFIELGDQSQAIDDLRWALFVLSFSDAQERRHEAALKIGDYAYPLDQELGLQAFTYASYYVYGVSQSGNNAATASLLQMQLARKYFAFGEYRLAREAAEKAQDRLSVVYSRTESSTGELEDAGLGEGRAVLANYEGFLAEAIRKTRPHLADQLNKRGPRYQALAKKQ